jgi:DNA gyrase subunit A
VITELPYQVNKARLVEKIAELMQEKRLDGIAAVRDESDRAGVRVVAELKKDEVAEVVLNQLYKLTQMQVTFGIIFLALVDNRPTVLSITDIIGHFIDHRKDVVTRRSRFELKQAEDRAHILQGLLKALDHIDEIVALIKASEAPADARVALMRTFDFTERQAQAILDMRLQRLTGLEREKLTDEFERLSREIARLKQILSDEQLLMKVIVQELQEIQTQFGDHRKTQIVEESAEVSLEDLILEEDMVVTITRSGYIKRTPASFYRSQRRGGKGRLGIVVKEEDVVGQLYVASTHHFILFFTDRGKVYWLKVHQLPQAAPSARGKAIVNLLNLSAQELVTATVMVRDFHAALSVFMATKHGTVKKTALQAFSHPRADGIIAITLDDNDTLVGVKLCSDTSEVFLGTRKGKAVRFRSDDVRDMGRQARGVRGIQLAKGDELVALEIVEEGADILTVSERGYGKRTNLSQYTLHRRGGKGLTNTMITRKNGSVAGIVQISAGDDCMLITDTGTVIRMTARDLPLRGRNTIGVKLIDLQDGERVAGLARVELAKKDLT